MCDLLGAGCTCKREQRARSRPERSGVHFSLEPAAKIEKTAAAQAVSYSSVLAENPGCTSYSIHRRFQQRHVFRQVSATIPHAGYCCCQSATIGFCRLSRSLVQYGSWLNRNRLVWYAHYEEYENTWKPFERAPASQGIAPTSNRGAANHGSPKPSW